MFQMQYIDTVGNPNIFHLSPANCIWQRLQNDQIKS